MTQRDSDIEFDFFDEPETTETTQRRRIPRAAPRRPGGPPKPPRRPGAPGGFAPLLRLVGLVAAAIFVVVVLVFVVQSCRGESKKNAYRDYMSDVTEIAGGSATVGRRLDDLLTTRGMKQSELEQKLTGLAQQESQYAARAQGIDPPGPLRIEHQHLVEVLKLRASGLSRLADAFHQEAKTKNATAAGAKLAEQAKLLVASDVNWDFYFKEPAIAELRRQAITGGAVPDSNFAVNPDLASTDAMAAIFQRIQGASVGRRPTGLHGTGLESTTAFPSGQVLQTSGNTITATSELAFRVAVKDTGESPEFKVAVVLTLERRAGDVVKRKVIQSIKPNEVKTVTFTDFPQPDFGEPSTLKVEIEAVPGETRISNNRAQYPIIFSLG